MAKSRKVIITCAVTGSIHTPSMSPHLPVTPQEIADNAIAAAEAGAAVVHLHARNPQDGRPDQTPEAFAPFLKVIKQRSNVVVNITTGGAPTMTATVQEAHQVALHLICLAFDGVCAAEDAGTREETDRKVFKWNR